MNYFQKKHKLHNTYEGEMKEKVEKESDELVVIYEKSTYKIFPKKRKLSLNF